MTTFAGGASAASFDLTTRPWIPVQLMDGAQTELSLLEVFAQARRVRRLVGDLPTQEFALTRLLLAIAHDALDGPVAVDDWARLWESQDPFAKVPAYLDKHRDRFDLLHPQAPFFQTAGLHTPDNGVSSLNRLVADVPNGVPLFTMRFPGVQRVSFAEAARWVVHAHAWDTAGIKTGVVGDPEAKKGKAYAGGGRGVAWAGGLGGVLAEGRDLRETLLLNLLAADSLPSRSDEDLPAWRRRPCGPGAGRDLAHRPTGVRDLYTWQSRRVLLHHNAEGVYGVVLSYGDPLAAENMHLREPMSGWRRDQARERKEGKPVVYLPRRHDLSRAVWRGLAALLAPQERESASGRDAPSTLRPGVVRWLARLTTERALPRGMLLRVRTFGMVYGTQQSVVDEVIADAVAVDVALLDERDRRLAQVAVDAVADAEAAVTALGWLAGDLVKTAGGEPKSQEAVRDTARAQGFAALDGPYRAWLADIREGDDGQELRARWQGVIRSHVSRLAAELIANAGRAAWQGRLVEAKSGATVWLNDCEAERRFWNLLAKALPNAPATSTDTTSELDSTEAPA